MYLSVSQHTLGRNNILDCRCTGTVVKDFHIIMLRHTHEEEKTKQVCDIIFCVQACWRDILIYINVCLFSWLWLPLYFS